MKIKRCLTTITPKSYPAPTLKTNSPDTQISTLPNGLRVASETWPGDIITSDHCIYYIYICLLSSPRQWKVDYKPTIKQHPSYAQTHDYSYQLPDAAVAHHSTNYNSDPLPTFPTSRKNCMRGCFYQCRQ